MVLANLRYKVLVTLHNNFLVSPVTCESNVPVAQFRVNSFWPLHCMTAFTLYFVRCTHSWPACACLQTYLLQTYLPSRPYPTFRRTY